MYKTNFNKKSKGTKSITFCTEAKTKAIDKVIDEYLKTIYYIAPTPFNINDECVKSEISISFKRGNKTHRSIVTASDYKLNNFCLVTKTCSNNMINWCAICPSVSLIIAYIINNIIKGNIVELDVDKVMLETHITKRTFYRAINTLLRPTYNYPCSGDSMALLAATNKKSVYVVNHNLIFKGNYDEFITNYKLLYTPEDLVLDDKGRVILSK